MNHRYDGSSIDLETRADPLHGRAADQPAPAARAHGRDRRHRGPRAGRRGLHRQRCDVRSPAASAPVRRPRAPARRPAPAPTPVPSPEGELFIYNWRTTWTRRSSSSSRTSTGSRSPRLTSSRTTSCSRRSWPATRRFDLTFPTDTDIPALVGEGLVVPLDLSLIPNVSNLATEWADPDYDPGHKHSMPYMWWTTGFAYDTEQVDEELASLASLWDPRFDQHLSMLDDQREAFAAALIRQGKSVNTVDDAELDAALALLKEQKPLLRLYSGDPIGSFKSGDVWVGHDLERRHLAGAGDATLGHVSSSPRRAASVDRTRPSSRRARRTRSPPTCSSTTCSTPRSAPEHQHHLLHGSQRGGQGVHPPEHARGPGGQPGPGHHRQARGAARPGRGPREVR